jgi:polysaccharide biosynthesis PFTS motif protein
MIIYLFFCVNLFYFKKKIIRNTIRGYRNLKKTSNLGFVASINQDLTCKKLNIKVGDLPSFMVGRNGNYLEISIRQFLLSRLAGKNLNIFILNSLVTKKEIIYPLPSEWISVLRDHGLKVNFPKSSILYTFFVLTHFCLGILYAFREIFTYKSSTVRARNSNSIHFSGLSLNNIPTSHDKNSRTVIDWYLNWADRTLDISQVTHTVKGKSDISMGAISVRNIGIDIPSIRWICRFNFLLWNIFAINIAFFYFVKGNWASALFFREILKSKKIDYVIPEEFAKEYFFSCSDFIYRPYWTYKLLSLGVKSSLYYYSVSLLFSSNQHIPYYELGLQSMTWDRLITFSKYHQFFLKRALQNNSEIKLSTPIYFSDTSARLLPPMKKFVAVFDSTPFRMSYRASLAPQDSFRTAPIGKDFLEQIYSALREKHYVLAWKRKRNYSKDVHHKGFIKFSEEFIKRPGVVDINSDIAAQRLIDKAYAVICLPYSSVGILAKISNKPCIFFSPTKGLHNKDPASSGIKVIDNIDDLNHWISEL